MRFGMLSRSLAALLTASTFVSLSMAQMMGGAPAPSSGPGGAPQGGAMQALFISPTGGGQGSAYVDAHGDSVVMPASYCGPAYGAPCPQPCGGPCEAPYCPPMGTNPPYSDYIDPIGVPGVNSEQCGPHYFDVRFEAVYMVRTETFGQDIIFSTLIPQAEDDPLPPVAALSSNQLDYDWEPGFRVLGRYDIGPLSVLEFGYTGIYSWETGATAIDPEGPDINNEGDLFSLWSRPNGASATDFEEYGTTPPTVQTAGGPMPQTERSLVHSISMESDLQTAEMNYRRYWVGFSPMISGTLLGGFRYTQMDEQFRFQTMGLSEEGDVESADYSVTTRNALAGFQTGGDVWIHVAQGVRIGGEGKVGIFNNRVKLRNNMAATPPIGGDPEEFPAVAEVFRNNQVAFLTEASVDVVIDVLPSWSLRAGYEVLYMNSIALAGENFNTGSPYGLLNQVPRVPFFADQGHALYHGAHAGLEYIW